jgi:BlaI family penicillinase repressor
VEPRQASVSEAELAVLKALWGHGPGTVRALQGVLRRRGQSWAYTTVQTLLQRLEAKGYVRSEKGSPAHVYHAGVSRAGLLNQRLRSLADQLCEGDASPLLLALVGEGRLSAEEVRQLRQLLDRLEPPPGPRRKRPD